MSVSGENDDEHEQLMQLFLQCLSRPEEELLPLFWPQEASLLEDKRHHLRQVCQLLFQQVEELAKLHERVVRKTDVPRGLSGLDQLFVGHGDDTVDAETLWGQVEFQNEALHSLIKSNLKKVIKAVESQDPVRLLDMGDIMASEEESANTEDKDSSEGESDKEGDDDEETKRMRARMERAMDDMDDSDMEDDNVLGEEQQEDAAKEEIEEESLEDPAAEELNDGFFDINEMEAFADEEEEYLPEEAFGTVEPTDESDEPRKSFHQKQREGDVESDSDNDDGDELTFKAAESTVKRRKYRQDSEIEALYKLYEDTPKDGDDDEDSVVNMTAAEFFGKPNKKDYEKWNSKKHETTKPKSSAHDDDADSWDDHNFDDEGQAWRDEESSAKKVTFRDEQVEEDEEPESDEEEASVEEKKADLSSSSYARQSEKLHRQTEEIEKELLAEKPWQMTGESLGTSRPVNSLLEVTPEFEVATKMAPLITVEHTANLEDVIKRRILDEDWDDVVPRELPDVAWNKKRGELPEVSQEKSKLSLGELYEREYLKKSVGYDVEAAEKQTEEEKARSEMKALFANLCSKLDALSNYHFAPRPIADEAEVRAVTTPAIAMEEVLPLHVSDARCVAPEELYGKKKGRDGVLRGDSELDQVRLVVTSDAFLYVLLFSSAYTPFYSRL